MKNRDDLALLPDFSKSAQLQQLSVVVQSTVQVLRDKNLTVSFAESCTGGLLSSEMTKVSGVSQVFKGAVVSYTNQVKEALLGVSTETLKTYGAVSAACAKEMAEGALKRLSSDFSISITGVAGPTGGTDKTPVGTVFIGIAGLTAAQQVQTQIFHHDFSSVPSREDIQAIAARAALEHLQDRLNE